MAWLFVVFCFVLVFSQTEDCSGPERNKIIDVLINVDWKDLVNQLNLTHQTIEIDVACRNQISAVMARCYLREVVGRFIQSQISPSCQNIVEKIAKALEEFGERHIYEANQLRQIFKIESQTSRSSESSTVESTTEPESGTMQQPSMIIALPTNRNFVLWIPLLFVIALFTYLFYKYCVQREPTQGLRRPSPLGTITSDYSGEEIGMSDAVGKLCAVSQSNTVHWGFWKDNDTQKCMKTSDIDGLGFVIAIIDTGINKDHAVFQDDMNSKIVLPESEDFNDLQDFNDLHGHGTWCAGIAAGKIITDQAGFKYDGGVASNASLLICKVGDTQQPEMTKVNKALEYIVKVHDDPNKTQVHIVSMSFGFDNGSNTLERWINKLTAKGIICVAAAGNKGRNQPVCYPAKYANVISIGAHDNFWNRAPFSPESPDVEYTTLGEHVCAPTIGSTEPLVPPQTALYKGSGTSLATPAVAGLIACILKHKCRYFKDFRNANKLKEVRNFLTAMTTPGDPVKALQPNKFF